MSGRRLFKIWKIILAIRLRGDGFDRVAAARGTEDVCAWRFPSKTIGGFVFTALMRRQFGKNGLLLLQQIFVGDEALWAVPGGGAALGSDLPVVAGRLRAWMAENCDEEKLLQHDKRTRRFVGPL